MIRSIIGNTTRSHYRNVHALPSYPYLPLNTSLKRLLATKVPDKKKEEEEEEDDVRLVVSIVGPPNAGKSTLFNRFMCKESNRSYRLNSEKNSRGKRKVTISGKLAPNMSTKRKEGVTGGAIVSSIPGTTRDKRECIGRIGGVHFTLFDTAGLDSDRLDHIVGNIKKKNELKRDMTTQTLEATKESDLILVLFDARLGVTSDLYEIGRWFRKYILSSQGEGVGNSLPLHKIVLVGNKLEGNTWASYYTPIREEMNYETNQIEYNLDEDEDSKSSTTILDHLNEASNALGFGNAIPISAQHGEGMADLATIIHSFTQEKKRILASQKPEEEATCPSIKKEKPLQLAILGRQNVGKSTLVNTLLNHKRVIVGPTPGLTRDAIAIHYTWNDTHPVKLVDTAGIRKVSSRIHTDDIEDQAVNDAIRAMKTADVAAIVLDSQAKYITKQELAIADAVIKEGRALVIVANKLDLITDEEYTKEEYASDVQKQLEIKFPFLRNTPVVPISSLTGENVDAFMPIVFRARHRWERKLSTSLLNSWLRQVLQDHPPPSASGGSMSNSRPIKIKYIIQTKGRPPTFLLFCNHVNIPHTYLKYLIRNFQDTFEMYGMEVRLALKISMKENPFEKKAGPKKKSENRRGVGGGANRLKRKMGELKKYGKPLKGFQKRKEYYKK